MIKMWMANIKTQNNQAIWMPLLSYEYFSHVKDQKSKKKIFLQKKIVLIKMCTKNEFIRVVQYNTRLENTDINTL